VRKLIKAALSTCALVFAAMPAWAQADYPKSVVTVTVPYPPGGSAEASLRPVAESLSKQWGQPVILVNKPGAGTTIGAAYVAEQKADGYSLLFTAVGSHTISAKLFDSLSYNAVTSFTPLSGVATSPYLIVVHPSSAVKTIQDLIADAKARPGKLNYGSSGTGTGPHLTGEILKRASNIDTQHISFKGAAPAITAILGRHIDYLITDISALSLVKSGQLRALAVTSLERSPFLPDVPTLNETVAKDFEATNRVVLMGPAGMSPALSQKIAAAVHEALKTEAVKTAYEPLGYVPNPLTGDELGKVLRSDTEKFGAIIKELGVKLE